MKAYWRLLRDNPDFARLWLAQVVSLLGDWFNTIVLAVLVEAYSGGSGLAVSLFLLARFVPPMLVGPWAGVLIDRLDRKRLLILSDVLRAVVVLLLLLADGPQLLWLVYLLTALQFTLSAFFEPGRNALLPSLLPREGLVLANTLGSITWSAMLAGGAIAGGLVAAQLGTQAALLIDSMTFLVSALLIVGIRTNTGTNRAEPAASGSSTTQNAQGLREGLRFLRHAPATLAVLLVKAGISLGSIDAVMIIYASRLFNFGEDSSTPLSIMYAAFGIGAVSGPVVLNRFNDGSVLVMRRLIRYGFLLMSVGWLTLAGAGTLPLVAVALTLRAMGTSVCWTYSSVIIQKSVPDRFLGRMFSLDMASFQFAGAFSILLTGFLIDYFGVARVRDVVLLMAGISTVPLTLWTLVVPRLEARVPEVEID
ncbi:MAG: MFS transporter [Anaerolineaceae bacterium]|nr:MFS transporter [Anaerolineaceae bacterium]MDE0329272.1 MFS transporter [Anaerolineaceae bacterium]